LHQGLVGHWSGVVGKQGKYRADLSVNHNTGVMTNFADINAAEVRGDPRSGGYAVTLNGTNNVILTTLTDSIFSGRSPYTLVAKFRTTDTVGILVGQRSSGSFVELFVDSDGKFKILRGANKTAGVDLSDDEWHTVVGTYDGDKIQLDYDNTVGTPVNSTVSLTPDGTLLRIGSRVTGDVFFAGSVASVSVYDRAVLPAESEWLRLRSNALLSLAPRVDPTAAVAPTDGVARLIFLTGEAA
jgi:hypothetical protein